MFNIKKKEGTLSFRLIDEKTIFVLILMEIFMEYFLLSITKLGLTV